MDIQHLYNVVFSSLGDSTYSVPLFHCSTSIKKSVFSFLFLLFLPTQVTSQKYIFLPLSPSPFIHQLFLSFLLLPLSFSLWKQLFLTQSSRSISLFYTFSFPSSILTSLSLTSLFHSILSSTMTHSSSNKTWLLTLLTVKRTLCV